MADTPAKPRRRFSHSLRTLFVALTVFGVWLTMAKCGLGSIVAAFVLPLAWLSWEFANAVVRRIFRPDANAGGCAGVMLWPQFSLARLMAGLCVGAIGMGLMAIVFHNRVRMPEIAIIGCVAVIWTGLALPFMRTVYAIAIGWVLAIPSWLGFVAWAFSTMRRQ